jgi:hypothetical protein
MKESDVDYPKEEKLFNEMMDLFRDYYGMLSLPAALGILDLVKDEIKANQEG